MKHESPSSLGKIIQTQRAAQPEAKSDSAFSAHRPTSSASNLLGRGQAASTQSLQSKLHDALTKPANRGILEAAVTVERIQKLRGIKA